MEALANSQAQRGNLEPSRVVKNDFLLRISIVCLQHRWRRRKNPQRIAEDTSAVFSSSPPRFVKTLKMLTTEPFFTTLLEFVRSLPGRAQTVGDEDRR